MTNTSMTTTSEPWNISTSGREVHVRPDMIKFLEEPQQTINVSHQIITIGVTLISLGSAIVTLVIVRKIPIFPANRAFILSLVISDIFQVGFVYPLSISTAVTSSWYLPPYVWLIQISCSVYLWLTGLYSLALVNIDHYIAVTEPSHYHQQLGPIKSSCWIVFIWILGLCYAVPLVLIGPDQVILCSTDILFCLVNYKNITAYSLTSLCILLPPPVAVFIATGFRGIINEPDDTSATSKERLVMYKANTCAGIVTIALWILGMTGAVGTKLPSIYRLTVFWLGASAPIWRLAVYWLMASSILRHSYAKQKSYLYG